MNRLINGDCLEAMDDLIASGVKVDAVITDPPYGTTACKWDSVIPFEPMWERLNKLIKPNGAIVLFGSEPFSSALRMSNIKMFKYDWIWEKNNPNGFLNAKKQPLRKYEIISVFYKKQCVYNPVLRDLPACSIRLNNAKGGTSSDSYGKKREGFKRFDSRVIPRDKGYPLNIIKEKGVQRIHNVHPTQKPVALMEYLIKTYTNEGETVLDFTMGSGTTGVACKNLDRKFIGIELDEKYFEIAKKRIE